MNRHFNRILTAVLALALALTLVPVGLAQTAESDIIHNVRLDPTGGVWPDGSTEPRTIQVHQGQAIDFAANTPTYEGNVLYGWYKQNGAPWPGARKVTEDVILRAKWSVAQAEVVYDLVLTIGGEPVTMEYDNGVYQFTVVSSIHHGYAQRSGKYTIYEAGLNQAIEADDGTAKRVLYKAESNYIDATGTLYGEFYNDGEFELFYDYVYNGQATKYRMDTGCWTYKDYKAPQEAVPLPDPNADSSASTAHGDFDTTLIGGEPAAVAAEEKKPDIVTLPGEVIFTADATNSETMKARFRENGVMTIFMTTYNLDIDSKYLWELDEENGMKLTYNGGEENIFVNNQDGTGSFPDNNGNTYQVSLVDLLNTMKTPDLLSTAKATNSETMSAWFYGNHTVAVKYDLTALGKTGVFHTVANGQWQYTEAGGLEIALGGSAMELQDMGDGTLQFTYDGNNYAVTLAELTAR